MTKEERNTTVDVAIVGGGIGGAAAAVALQRAGFTVDVYEQASELREVGGAIVIREPSLALFRQWGLEPAFARAAVAVDRIELRTRSGEVEGTMPVAVSADEPARAHSVHRADVHSMLVGQIPTERLHLGCRLERVETGDDFAYAHFVGGAQVRARLLIGADGLRSVARSLLDATEMKFAGQMTHRTVVPSSALPVDLPNDRLRMWRSEERLIIFLPVHGGRDFAVDAVVWQDEPPAELWSPVSPDALLETYADFDPVVRRALAARSSEVTSHPVYDKAPLATWARGRVVLLGDAAHPMAPMQGQGANSAIQDAGALANELGRTGIDLRIAGALHAYESLRGPITAEMQARSRVIPTPKLSPPT